ncbi:universal stress protein [Nocardia arizonensis]|uniref:universal stress protein n=1 Tax=Nocardia arizonensis TaxID=1141647 RepID=UPI000AB34D7D|nr:universal stress protein [Nocardia arizonensis]
MSVSPAVSSDRVVVGVDGSQGSWAALRWAAEFAAARGRELLIVHGCESIGTSWVAGDYEILLPSVIDTVREQGQRVLARAEDIALAVAPGLRVSSELATDSGRRLLIEHSHDADAVVLGATGNTGTIAHLGSTLLAVTAHAEGPVVVVRGETDADGAIGRVGPVVVGVDDDPSCAAAIAAAFAEADARGAELVAVHCRNDWAYAGFDDRTGRPDDEADRLADAILTERLARGRQRYPRVRVRRQVRTAEPGHCLLAMSKQARLVVVGSRGRGGFAGLLFGSTVNTLVQHAACPVMVVHPVAAPTAHIPRTTAVGADDRADSRPIVARAGSSAATPGEGGS